MSVPAGMYEQVHGNANQQKASQQQDAARNMGLMFVNHQKAAYAE
jgi:hypothetical protein